MRKNEGDSYSNREGYHAKVGGNIGSQKASVLCDWLLKELPTGATEFNATFDIGIPFAKQRTGLVQCYCTVNAPI
jgi:hypothetical protein